MFHKMGLVFHCKANGREFVGEQSGICEWSEFVEQSTLSCQNCHNK